MPARRGLNRGKARPGTTDFPPGCATQTTKMKTTTRLSEAAAAARGAKLGRVPVPLAGDPAGARLTTMSRRAPATTCANALITRLALAWPLTRTHARLLPLSPCPFSG